MIMNIRGITSEARLGDRKCPENKQFPSLILPPKKVEVEQRTIRSKYQAAFLPRRRPL